MLAGMGLFEAVAQGPGDAVEQFGVEVGAQLLERLLAGEQVSRMSLLISTW